jgi:hypothetical protein
VSDLAALLNPGAAVAPPVQPELAAQVPPVTTDPDTLAELAAQAVPADNGPFHGYDQRYLVRLPGDDKPHLRTRVTTFIKALDSQENLIPWKAAMAMTGMMRRPGLHAKVASLLAEHPAGWYAGDDVKKELKGIVEECAEAGGSSDRADQGTGLHRILHVVNRGVTPVLMDPYKRDVDAYVACLDKAGIRPRPALCEVTLWIPGEDERPDLVGTADMFADWPEYPDLATVVDAKTGATLKPLDFATQLGCYSLATHALRWGLTADAVVELEPLPPLNMATGLIVHLPAGSGTCELYRVDLDTGRQALVAAASVRKYRNLGKRKDGGGLLLPFIKVEVATSAASVEELMATVLTRDEAVAVIEATGVEVPSDQSAVATGLEAMLSAPTPVPVDPNDPTADHYWCARCGSTPVLLPGRECDRCASGVDHMEAPPAVAPTSDLAAALTAPAPPIITGPVRRLVELGTAVEDLKATPADPDVIAWLRRRTKRLVNEYRPTAVKVLDRWPDGIDKLGNEAGTWSAFDAGAIQGLLEGVEAEDGVPFGESKPVPPEPAPVAPERESRFVIPDHDEGARVTDAQLAKLEAKFDTLTEAEGELIRIVGAEANALGYMLNVENHPTERRLALAHVLIRIAQASGGDHSTAQALVRLALTGEGGDPAPEGYNLGLALVLSGADELTKINGATYAMEDGKIEVRFDAATGRAILR